MGRLLDICTEILKAHPLSLSCLCFSEVPGKLETGSVCLFDLLLQLRRRVHLPLLQLLRAQLLRVLLQPGALGDVRGPVGRMARMAALRTGWRRMGRSRRALPVPFSPTQTGRASDADGTSADAHAGTVRGWLRRNMRRRSAKPWAYSRVMCMSMLLSMFNIMSMSGFMSMSSVMFVCHYVLGSIVANMLGSLFNIRH